MHVSATRTWLNNADLDSNLKPRQRSFDTETSEREPIEERLDRLSTRRMSSMMIRTLIPIADQRLWISCSAPLLPNMVWLQVANSDLPTLSLACPRKSLTIINELTHRRPRDTFTPSMKATGAVASMFRLCSAEVLEATCLQGCWE